MEMIIKVRVIKRALGHLKNSIIRINNPRSHSFALPIILNLLGKEPSDNDPFMVVIFQILILGIICLLCFINVIGYFSAIYLLNKFNLETKYPKLSKFLKYFERSSFVYILIEGFICLFFLIGIILLCLLFLGILTIN